MVKDRDYYFRVKPADEALVFERVDSEAEGLYSKMRRDAFRGEPRGFLVDFRGVPVSLEDMADGYRMSNGRFKARFTELHDRQIIQTAAEYGASLRTLKSAWALRKVTAFRDIMTRVRGGAEAVYVIPALLDEVLDRIVGSTTGNMGWEDDGQGGRRRRRRGEDGDGEPIAPPLGKPSRDEKATQPARLLPNSHSQSQNQSTELQPQPSVFERERSLPPRALQDGGEGTPMSWAAYTARAHEIQVWQQRIGAVSEESFAAQFEARFQISWSVWCDIKRRMELSIPQPCQDGRHVLDDTSGYCRECSYVRVGDEV